jgi:hypothetical protein
VVIACVKLNTDTTDAKPCGDSSAAQKDSNDASVTSPMQSISMTPGYLSFER